MKLLCLSILLTLSTLSLYAQSNEVIYSFETKNHKLVQLLYNESDRIFTYRFISKGKVELEVVDDLKDKDTIFTVSGYHRGGGVQNAAMDLNDVYFTNKDYTYNIYYVWAIDEENPEKEHPGVFGIRISKDGEKTVDLVGRKIVAGEIYGWSFHDILPVRQQE